jgi:hypothetical protein
MVLQRAFILNKEDRMKRKIKIGMICISLLVLACLFVAVREGQAAGKQELIGKVSINWNLVSHEGKRINYGPEYYDRYFLIMTFFPAAFTPV